MHPRARWILTACASGLIVLATSVHVQGQETEVTVVNEPPSVLEVVPSAATVLPTAGGTTPVTITANFADANGFNDIQSVNLSILRPDGSELANTTAPTRTNASDGNATYQWTHAIPFHEPPGTYSVLATVTDASGGSATNTGLPSTFTYAPLVAMSLDASALSFGGAVRPGATSSPTPLGVTNLGNVRMDVDVSGTPLTLVGGSAAIPPSQVAYSLAAGMAGAASLASAPATVAAFDLERGASSAQDLYLQLTVPTASQQQIPPGTYRGTVTVAAVGG